MKDKELIVRVLIGIPASGKTTYTKNFLANNPDWIAVNRDSYRYMLRNQGLTEVKIESMISELVDITIIKSLNRRMNVIVDATNLKLEYLKHFVELCKHKARIEFLSEPFNIPVETCIERDKLREQKVGAMVIRVMYKNWKNIIEDPYIYTVQPQVPAYEQRFVPLEQDKSLPKVVIYDIDGTLALMGKRSPYDFDKVDRDDPNHVVIDTLKMYREAGYKIILLTGRDASARELTEYWLQVYGIEYDELYTRPNDSKGNPVQGKDTKIKKDIFFNKIFGRYFVWCVFDDRLSVVLMWESIGIFCFNVNLKLLDF